MLILQPSCSIGAMATETEMFRLTSSGSKSVVVVPSSTRPWRFTAPEQKRSASARVVLPAPPWPTRATLRIWAGGYVFTGTSLRLASPPRTGRSPEVSGRRWYLEEGRNPAVGSSLVFDGRFRATVDKGVRPVGAGLRRTGITADQLTAVGLVLAVACAVAVGSGHLLIGMFLLVAAAVPDLLDGAVAKASGMASPRGAYFDSVSDR